MRSASRCVTSVTIQFPSWLRTNDELAKLSLVTDDVARVSGHASVVSEHAANMSQLFAATLGGPLIRGAAIAHGLRTALKGRKK